MRKIVYLAALLGCLMFYTFYQEWLGFILTAVMVGLPIVSLIISIPAMRRFQVRIAGADAVTMGTPASVRLEGQCDLPMPPFSGRLKLRYCMTGHTVRRRNTTAVSAAHCGAVTVTAEKVRVYDYLGLIGFPVRTAEPRTVTVRPLSVAMKPPAGIEYILARAWRPRAGGGYSEYHEMRPYRPGDNLNQIHWKLTAKTDDLIVREPMQPDKGAVLLTIELSGTAEELDRKFGRLLYFGNYLLDRGVGFEVCAVTALGQITRTVVTEADLVRVIDTLLCCEAATTLPAVQMPVSRQICIGGEPQ